MTPRTDIHWHRKASFAGEAADLCPAGGAERESFIVNQIASTKIVAKRSVRPADRKLGIVSIDGTLLNLATEEEAVARIVGDAVRGHGGTVFTLNLDHLVKLEENAAFRAAYDQATYVSADGLPVVYMARWAGADITRVTGSDLLVPLSREAAAAGVSVHLFGTTDAVLERAAARLCQEAPGLRIAGMESPPMGFDPKGPAALAAAERIAASGASLCFVALGAPKQELFAHAAAAAAPNVMFLCIGAGLDFLAGEQRRAPVFLQDAGLEWLWRLAEDPRRLTGRYWRSAKYLFGYIARKALRLPSPRPLRGSAAYDQSKPGR